MTAFVGQSVYAGLNSQLYFKCLYHSIGTAAGLTYNHTPLVDGRHDFLPGQTTDDFLGLGLDEIQAGQLNEAEYINLYDQFGVGLTFQQLVDNLRQYVATKPERLFELGWRMSSGTWSDVWGRLVEWSSVNPIDFKTKYWKARAADGYDAKYYKAIVHIRRGTTVEHKGTRSIDAGEQITLKEFSEAIDILFDAGLKASDIAIFSDGFARTFYWSKNDLPLSVQEKRVCELTKELNDFAAERGVDLVVGETFATLQQTIHAFATTDLVVSGVGYFAPGCVRRFNRKPAHVFRYPWVLTRIRSVAASIV